MRRVRCEGAHVLANFSVCTTFRGPLRDVKMVSVWALLRFDDVIIHCMTSHVCTTPQSLFHSTRTTLSHSPLTLT